MVYDNLFMVYNYKVHVYARSNEIICCSLSALGAQNPKYVCLFISFPDQCLCASESGLRKSVNVYCHSADCAHTHWANLLCGNFCGRWPITMLANRDVLQKNSSFLLHVLYTQRHTYAHTHTQTHIRMHTHKHTHTHTHTDRHTPTLPFCSASIHWLHWCTHQGYQTEAHDRTALPSVGRQWSKWVERTKTMTVTRSTGHRELGREHSEPNKSIQFFLLIGTYSQW